MMLKWLASRVYGRSTPAMPLATATRGSVPVMKADDDDKPEMAAAPAFCALLIGINKYKYASSGKPHNLHGCVADAEDMYEYLTKTRGISSHSITILRDEDATRATILNKIHALKDHVIKNGTPILIFWAGHGSRALREGTRDHYIEMLIPHDFDPDSKDRYQQGIPDYEFGRELSDLARAKGNNITVILDVCHAGSSTRDEVDYEVRGFDLPQDYTSDRGPNAGIGSWKAADLTSHVLLAATSASNPAREEEGRGVFTRALMKFLRGYEDPDLLTYTDVIRGLPKLEQREGGYVQHPQCEGQNAGRLLFTNFVRRDGYRYRLQGDHIILKAGAIHGITTHALFAFYGEHGPNRPPVLSDLKAKEVNVDHAVFYFPADPELRLPSEGWASQMSYGSSSAGTSKAIVLDSDQDSQPTISHSAVSDLNRGTFGRWDLTSPHNDQQQLLITKDGNKNLVFELTDEVARKAGLTHLKPSIKHPYLYLQEIMDAASAFFHHLGRSNPQQPLQHFVKVKAYLLEEYGDPPTPIVKNNLLAGGNTMNPEHVYDAEHPGPHRCYGFEITNTYHESLYAWIFAFNLNDLSIEEVYRPGLAKEKTDVCIKSGSALTIGYGTGGVVPQAFFVESGEDTAVTYLKIFLSSGNVDLSRIPQESAFRANRKMGGAIRNITPTILEWDTLQVAIIQKSPLKATEMKPVTLASLAVYP